MLLVVVDVMGMRFSFLCKREYFLFDSLGSFRQDGEELSRECEIKILITWVHFNCYELFDVVQLAFDKINLKPYFFYDGLPQADSWIVILRTELYSSCDTQLDVVLFEIYCHLENVKVKYGDISCVHVVHDNNLNPLEFCCEIHLVYLTFIMHQRNYFLILRIEFSLDLFFLGELFSFCFDRWFWWLLLCCWYCCWIRLFHVF